MITEDYVSFETAKLLKEKGFDEKCQKVYMHNGQLLWAQNFMEGETFVDNISVDIVGKCALWNCEKQGDYAYLCPTLQMAIKWLRKVHNFHIWVEPNHDKEGLYNAHVKVGQWSNNWTGVGYNSHEEACEAAIKYCLEKLI